MPPVSPLSADTRQILTDLKSRIRSYVFWEGLALTVILLGLLFWVSFAIDWAYFRISRLELPRWFRASVLVISIGLMFAASVSWILLRQIRRFRSKSLALVLERRFPELDDRLITAVEAAEGLHDDDSPVTAAMLQKTLNDVTKLARQFDLNAVFDRAPLRRSITIGVGLFGSILGLMVVDLPAMERWVSGYLRLEEHYWSRETELVIRTIVQPGDQIREFVDRQYKHPKGGDLTMSIEVPKGKKVPERIRLDLRMGRGQSQIYLTPSADGHFHHTLPGLIEETRLWVSGGDFSHTQPYVVLVVPPPEVKQITLNCLYPEYTGLNVKTANGIERTANVLRGSQISLPMQTDLQLQLTANKPLRRARIEGDAHEERWEVEVNFDGSPTATITLKSQDGKPQVQVAIPYPATTPTAESTAAFTLPFQLSPDGATGLPAELRLAASENRAIRIPINLPPDSPLRVTLEDTDRITSPTPIRFTINAIVDQPPLIETRLKGIGTAVTRKARIPIAGTITDDYGIKTAQFEYRIDDKSDWQIRTLAVSPADSPKDFVLKRSANDDFERFDLQPLDLSIKQKLTLTVAAIDECTVPGTAPPHSDPNAAPTTETAHHAQGLKYVFTVIPEEELLSMLYGRELILRKRMEQILTETVAALKDLQAQKERLPEWNRLKAANTSNDDERMKSISLGMNAAADRSLLGIRKNAIETASIETSFADIREELINNSAETPAMLERLDDKILTPLGRINTVSFPNVDGALGLFKLALDKGSDPRIALESSIDETARLVQQLESVLGDMAELARFDAVIEEFKKLLKSETDLLDETRRKRKEKAIKDLE